MNAEELAQHLLPQPTSTIIPQELQPQLSLEVVQALKRHVDREQFRDPAYALQIAAVAHQVAGVLGSAEAEALADWMGGNAAYFLGQYTEALHAYERAHQTYAVGPPRLEAAILLINQVGILQELGAYERAFGVAAQARALCSALGEQAFGPLAGLEMNLGCAYQQQGQLDQALAAFDRARSIFAQRNDMVQVVRVDINIANVYEELSHFRAAEMLLLQARTQLSSQQLDQEVARANLNLGRLAYRRGQYQQALGYLELAHSGFLAAANQSDVALVNLLRAYVYRDLNLLEETLTLAQEAEQVFALQQTTWQQALALLTQGIAYQRSARYAAADQAFRAAQRLFADQGATIRSVLLDVDRAALALELGEAATAQQLATAVLQQIDSATWPGQAARSQLLLARCILQRTPAARDQARQLIEASLQTALDHDLTDSAIHAYAALGQLCEQAGDLAAGLAHYQTAVDFTEQLRHWLPVDVLHLHFMDDKLRLYADVVRLTQQLHTPAQVWYALQLGHTAIAQRFAQQPVAPDDLALLEQLDRLREQWHWYHHKREDQEVFTEVPIATPSIVQGQLQSVETELAEISRRWWVRRAVQVDPEFGAAHVFDQAHAALLFHQLQAQLAQDERFLYYYVVQDQLHVLVISQAEATIVPHLISTSALDRLLEAWLFHAEHAHLRASGGDDIGRRYGSRLHQALLAPLTDQIQGVQHLRLALPAAWSNLPIAALYDGTSYLAERMECTQVAHPRSVSPAAVLQLRPHDTALVLGYSDQGRLPAALREAQQVADQLSSHLPTTCLLENAVTRTAVEAALSSSRLIHCASHAVFRPDNPLFSWIALADSRLTVADMYALRLPQQPLVVLSACETGRGNPRGGGLLGMERGFLAAGAAGLVVNLWKVLDQPLAQVMNNFYQALLDGTHSPGRALHLAQQQAIAAGMAPTVWASLIYLQG